MDRGYDVIADVHGEADALKRLLEKMGYSRSAGGAWGHGSRTAVFVGDLVDRGPEQMEVIDIVRRMISAGTAHAVMGNHELNAIAWATEDGAGSHMRPRTEKNHRQHARFLEQPGEDSQTHREVIEFFKTLPLWFEIGGLRVVHACWHQHSVDLLRPHLDVRGRLKEDVWSEALRRGTDLGFAVDVLLKGPELELPEGRSFIDKDGNLRTAVRVKWWDSDATTYRKAAISIPGDETGDLPDDPISDDFRYRGDIPVIFGHYWMSGEPSLSHRNVSCVDFSVAKQDGNLVAYRWSGEKVLTPDNLAYVPAAEPEVTPVP
jgi:hypothetical protein